MNTRIPYPLTPQRIHDALAQYKGSDRRITDYDPCGPAFTVEHQPGKHEDRPTITTFGDGPDIYIDVPMNAPIDSLLRILTAPDRPYNDLGVSMTADFGLHHGEHGRSLLLIYD